MTTLAVINQEVPFKLSGNRRYLERQQMDEMPWLSEFVEQFKECFEVDDVTGRLWFYPQ